MQERHSTVLWMHVIKKRRLSTIMPAGPSPTATLKTARQTSQFLQLWGYREAEPRDDTVDKHYIPRTKKQCHAQLIIVQRITYNIHSHL